MNVGDNKLKMEHGEYRIRSMTDRLEELVSYGEIASYGKKVRRGYEGYQDDQFYAPFEIVFEDGTLWEVFSTTCWKDRYKQSEWDAYNLKQIEPRIECCVISLSNLDSKTKRDAHRENDRRVSGRFYSFIDAVYTDAELFEAIEQRSYEIRELTIGQVSNKKGKKFEKRLVSVISSKDNYLRWREGNQLIVGDDYQMFSMIVERLGLDSRDIVELTATDDIPKLPTGGLPKTDVAILAKHLDGTVGTYTISCKRSGQPRVSVMQFDADDLIEAVGIVEDELKDSLRKQQECGSRSQLIARYGSVHAERLTSLLPKYVASITEWVLGGVLHPSDPIQVADWVLTQRDHVDAPSSVHFMGVGEYAKAIVDIKGQYGTPFSWTYHHAGEKRQIQLKIPILD